MKVLNKKMGGFLKTKTAQRVQHLVLNGFDGRRKIGNEMLRVRIKADHRHVTKKTGDVSVGFLREENLVVHAWQKVLLKPADGFRRPGDGLADMRRIKPHERAVALRDFDDDYRIMLMVRVVVAFAA